jgi:hypothetical protein
LIQVLRDIGVNVNEDEDRPGHKVPLTEIDPFTFLFFLGKHKNEWNKIKVIREICSLWNINVVVNDVCGIPTANAQKLWMFSYQYGRTNEIEKLWDLFDLLLSNSITDSLFKEIVNQAGVGKIKLTEAFFIINPTEYLCINAKVKPYLLKKGINSDFENFSQYKSILLNIKNTSTDSFVDISYQSYIESEFNDLEPNFYRIGTTAGESGVSVLNEMITNSVASIGWGEIGDLQNIEPFNVKHIVDALKQKGYYLNQNQKSVASRKAGEILKFKNEIKPYDYILAADGNKIKAIGQVISHQYVFDESLEFPHLRYVKWIRVNIDNLHSDEGLRTSVWKCEDENTIQKIKDFIGLNNGNINNLEIIHNNMALNTILFGPPGTGKTYTTIDKAIDLIIGENNLDRIAKKLEFNRLQNDGRIYFTTFHQNMAYEDFIEGIKPVEPNDDDEYLQYEIQDGLFMKACIEASYNFIKRNHPDNEQENQVRTFNQLYDQLFNQIGQEEEIQLETLNGGNVLVSITDQGDFSVRHNNGTRTYTVSRNRLAPLYDAFENLNDINNIHIEFRNIIGGCNSTAFWSVLNAIHHLQLDNNVDEEETILSYEDKKNIVKSFWKTEEFKVIENDLSEPFVFIIDEINRGNIAQIFGELITLIEDDKRLGKAEEIRLQLPYSKQAFCVPPILYIIGTMNTADRSVEALDTALRRRFVFEPKMPKEDELTAEFDGINLKVLLSTINKRLRILKDNDHTIGHAWLMRIENLDQLTAGFEKKIIPLLQEYFYNDYEKLGLVLGDNFFIETQRVNGSEFANFGGSNSLSSQYKSKFLYELKDMSTLTSEDFRALIGLPVENEE